MSVGEMPDQVDDEMPDILIGPQEGPQEQFVGSDADIVFCGGQAGGGKTYGLLLCAAQYIGVEGYGAVIFRRTMPQISNEGGLWDESQQIYPLPGIDGVPKVSSKDWFFPASGANIGFRALQYEKDLTEWMGAQISFIGFDEITHFTKGMFFYMISRARSTCGVKPHIRCTCNPIPADDPIGGWVHQFLQWWIDDATGLAIPERSGVIRWLVVKKSEWFWANTREEAIALHGRREFSDDHPNQVKPKSVTFIPAKLSDNPKLEEKDPDYRGNLEMQEDHVRQQLLEGNWNAKRQAGTFFKIGVMSKPGMIIKPEELPKGLRWCRAWDLAATEGAGDWTVGGKMATDSKGTFYIVEVIRGQWETGYRDARMLSAAISDDAEHERCMVRLPQDPAAAGKSEAERLVKMFRGHWVEAKPVSGDKALRARGFASQFNAGNVKMVEGPWNSSLLDRLDRFPTKGIADDEIDALSDAHTECSRPRIGAFVANADDKESEPDNQAKMTALTVGDYVRDKWAQLVQAAEPMSPRWKNSLADFRADVGKQPTEQHTLKLRDENDLWKPENVVWVGADGIIPKLPPKKLFGPVIAR